MKSFSILRLVIAPFGSRAIAPFRGRAIAPVMALTLAALLLSSAVLADGIVLAVDTEEGDTEGLVVATLTDGDGEVQTAVGAYTAGDGGGGTLRFEFLEPLNATNVASLLAVTQSGTLPRLTIPISSAPTSDGDETSLSLLLKDGGPTAWQAGDRQVKVPAGDDPFQIVWESDGVVLTFVLPEETTTEASYITQSAIEASIKELSSSVERSFSILHTEGNSPEGLEESFHRLFSHDTDIGKSLAVLDTNGDYFLRLSWDDVPVILPENNAYEAPDGPVDTVEFVFFLAGEPVLRGDEQLVNGDFETWINENLDGWAIDVDSNDGDDWALDQQSDRIWTGEYGASMAYQGEGSLALSQSVSIPARATNPLFAVRLWIEKQGDGPGNGAESGFFVLVNDERVEMHSSADDEWNESTELVSEATDGWRLVLVDLSAYAGQTIDVAIGVTNTGGIEADHSLRVYVDGATLRSGTIAPRPPSGGGGGGGCWISPQAATPYGLIAWLLPLTVLLKRRRRGAERA